MYKAQKGLNDVSIVSFLIQLRNRTLTKKKKSSIIDQNRTAL
jgi:hypothetical protein